MGNLIQAYFCDIIINTHFPDALVTINRFCIIVIYNLFLFG